MFKGPIPTGPLDVVLAVGAIAFNFWYQHRKEKREKENIKYKAEQEAYYQSKYGVNTGYKK